MQWLFFLGVMGAALCGDMRFVTTDSASAAGMIPRMPVSGSPPASASSQPAAPPTAVATPVTATSAPAKQLTRADYYAMTADQFFALPEVQQKIAKDSVHLELLEAAVFQQTNRERVANKLPVFKYSAALNVVARGHSKEMSDLQYFEHDSPTPANKTMGDRLRNVGLVNVTAGENIAVLPAMEMGSGRYITHRGQGDAWFDEVTGKRVDYYTYADLAKDVSTQWMNSPHHHENIVRKEYVYLGVGIARGPYDEKKQDSFYFTQNFCATRVAAAEQKAEAQLKKDAPEK